MRHLDTLEPGERFTLPLTKRAGTVLEQHEGSVRVKWDAYDSSPSSLLGPRIRSLSYKEHISRKTEVE